MDILISFLRYSLVSERLALGAAAFLAPSLFTTREAQLRETAIYVRGFGIRHLLLGLVLWKGNLSRKQLSSFAYANAAVELIDGGILLQGYRGRKLRWLALGSLVGASGCLMLGSLARQSIKSKRPSSRRN